MRRLNDGMVCTNDKCIGCNKCISTCPVLGANVSVIEDGHASIKVSSQKCIHCGACIENCFRGARSYEDDTELFFEALSAGARISLLVDPAFYYLYPEEMSSVFGFLKAQGVDKIYDIGYGAEISLWGHVKYIKNNMDSKDRAYIMNRCPAMLNFFEKYDPELLPQVIPVQSPLMCTAIYASNYAKDTNTLAVLTPCPAVRDESDSQNGIVKYVVTIRNLMEKLKGEHLSTYEGGFDVKAKGYGALISLSGGFKYLADLFFERDSISMHHEGITPEYLNALGDLSDSQTLKPVFADLAACVNGCVTGVGISSSDMDFIRLNKSIDAIKNDLQEEIRGTGDVDENFRLLDDMMSDIDIDDFLRAYKNRYRQPYRIPESTYDEIFNSMYKDEEWKRHIDCGSCGYESCHEMAKAIAYGYNKMENCIRYMNDELLMRYYTDPLTKINNKQGFAADVRRLYDKNPKKTYVIGVVSLNQLNIINDMHGFALGDMFICKAAEVFSEYTGKAGGTCGRLGGGEFLICFENERDYLDVIHNMGTFNFDDIEVSFPLSFRAGLYVDENRSETIDIMINYASMARDKIEEDGISTCLFYNRELKERLAAESMVTSQMYAALENKEFVAYFQPQYSHRTGKIVGAETLCRWVKKDGSVISPGLFIPIFEKNGFIKALDKYMWEQAFIAVSKWEAIGCEPVPISVNISRVSLGEPDFVDSIRALYEKYPIPTELLHFEITESAYSARQDVVARKINAIRDMGFLVAMDDFGSGYSSLNVLKDMPLDILKLDMGFLRGRNQEKGESIIRNVVTMIRELQFTIISEGVETIDQAEFLKHVGCDIIQGYLYAKPMPLSEYEGLIRAV